jgi:hypothetical protein
MLLFNPKRVFALRGIVRMSGFLVRLGFNYTQATKFLKAGKPTIKIKHIEQLCVALNCTPNDLFEWKAETNTVLPETHSLNRLQKAEKMQNLQQLVRDIPSDKLNLIASLLEELKK